MDLRINDAFRAKALINFDFFSNQESAGLHCIFSSAVKIFRKYFSASFHSYSTYTSTFFIFLHGQGSP